MPAIYTHHHYGRQLIPLLPDNLRNAIHMCLPIYYLGLCGPDIFFYYHPYLPNTVSKTGFGTHYSPARAVLEPARHMMRRRADIRLQVYCAGFISHFMLDSTCHPIVKEKIASSGIAHVAIETEFDRMLMLKDGCDPFNTNASATLDLSLDNANVIAAFFPHLSAQQVLQSIRWMRFYQNLILYPSEQNRKTIQTILKATHMESTLGGLILPPLPNPKCADSNLRLQQACQNSILETAILITEYISNLSQDIPLNPRFDRDFE